MMNLKRVATEIKRVGLYNLILQDIEILTKNKKISEEEILQVLKEKPEILEEYKQTNLEYNLSNIHLTDIPLEETEEKHLEKAKIINQNLQELREIEKYTLDFSHSSVLVIIFSIEFFVLFSAQYFIVLLNLKEWQLEIFGTFALSIVVAWFIAKKAQKKYAEKSAVFEMKFDETLQLLKELEEEGGIQKETLLIEESDDHI